MIDDFPDSIMIGAMEHHKCGRPHFHCVLVTGPHDCSEDTIMDRVTAAWHRASGWSKIKQGGDPIVYAKPAHTPIAYARYSLKKDEHEYRKSPPPKMRESHAEVSARLRREFEQFTFEELHKPVDYDAYYKTFGVALVDPRNPVEPQTSDEELIRWVLQSALRAAQRS